MHTQIELFIGEDVGQLETAVNEFIIGVFVCHVTHANSTCYDPTTGTIRTMLSVCVHYKPELDT